MVTVGDAACAALEMQCIIQRGVSVISVVSVVDRFKVGRYDGERQIFFIPSELCHKLHI